MDFPKLLKSRQAAELLGISIKTLRKLCQSGKIRYIKIDGKNFRFRVEDLEQYLVAQTVQVKEKTQSSPRPAKAKPAPEQLSRAQLKEQMDLWSKRN
jgi:excisionase family DNA binding protein